MRKEKGYAGWLLAYRASWRDYLDVDGDHDGVTNYEDDDTAARRGATASVSTVICDHKKDNMMMVIIILIYNNALVRRELDVVTVFFLRGDSFFRCGDSRAADAGNGVLTQSELSFAVRSGTSASRALPPLLPLFPSPWALARHGAQARRIL